MTYKLTKGIDNVAEYNLGGISNIRLLNIDDFIAYQFREDGLHSSGYVDALYKRNPFLELGRVEETSLKETLGNGIYKQELNTFVRSLSEDLINWLQYALNGKYLVILRTMYDRYFAFGSDGGAKLSYSGQTGQTGELNGITIKLEKSSVYPLFEVNPEALKTRVLGSESLSYMTNETNHIINTNYLIEIP